MIVSKLTTLQDGTGETKGLIQKLSENEQLKVRSVILNWFCLNQGIFGND